MLAMFPNTGRPHPYVGLFSFVWSFIASLFAFSVSGQQYLQGSYNPSYDFQVPHANQMAELAIQKLRDSPIWVPGWDQNLELGQVSAVSVDKDGRVHIFHRAGRSWDATTFDLENRYSGTPEPISNPTILVVESNGTLVDLWGENMFYMPHGLTVDGEGNTWLTDVALHQVFKFKPGERKSPALVLGTRFVPGDDEDHFCKPSAVAVLDSGDFFVSDGYCNSRVIKYNRLGQKILQLGRDTAVSQNMPPPYALFIPHALTIATKQELVCVADRENGRVQCFHIANGTFHSQYHNWLVGGRLFSCTYSPRDGGVLYMVNGADRGVIVRGYVANMTSSRGELLQSFSPPGAGFATPHDIAVSPDGREIYVAELDPHKVHKFVEKFTEPMVQDETRTNAVMKLSARVKPTATIEEPGAVYVSGRANGAWIGVAGGAAGGLGAVLLCALLAGVALLRARRNGRLKRHNRRRWEYNGGEFKLRRLLEPRGFQRVNTDESDEEPHAMLPAAPATA